MTDLKNKTVLVTGASKGIGAAVAEAMAKQGANVIINYNHDEAAAKKVTSRIEKQGVRVLVVQADVSRQVDVDRMFKEIKEVFTAIDVLVSNAGGVAPGDGYDNPDAIDKIVQTNLIGSARVVEGALKMMKKGKIVLMSSIHGRLGHGNPGVIGYSASKAALDSYMKNLAKTLAPGILVNSVAPGRTLTPAWGNPTGKRKQELAQGQAIERWIEPSEIADGVVFLAKNDAVCGEVLTIDGGMSLRILG